ncbi:lysine-specific demethylase 5B isoform X2 [Thalictrum thalictroides]|uniref:Lysine-specific demethylase 5B isoform X2 n=1 Tax=Thalictrum thalictroides TaxID=46969 RepID=A0A7J6WDT0_THATH|nr:lysine-specific demethylase 5B isoform X2 [Thalictrum thalictroides]
MPPSDDHELLYDTPDTGRETKQPVPCCNYRGKPKTGWVSRKQFQSNKERPRGEQSKRKEPAKEPDESDEESDKEPWEYISTGFMVEVEGKPYVITTSHSVPSNRLLLEVMDSNDKSYEGDLVFYIKGIDLALLSLKDSESKDDITDYNFSYLDVSSNPPPPIGTNITTIGHPMQLNYSCLRGQLASNNIRTLDYFLRPEDAKDIDFPGDLEVLHINNQHGQKGISGGPIFDDPGNLIGMMSFILYGYDFAIPVSTIKKFLDDFIVHKKEKEKGKELQFKKHGDEEQQQKGNQHQGGKQQQGEKGKQHQGGKGKQQQGRKRSSESSSQSGRPYKRRVLDQFAVKRGAVTHAELAEEWLLNSLKTKIVQNSLSKAAYVNDLKEAEQFLWAGAEINPVKCMQCSYCSNTFDPFLDLSLEITKADSLLKAHTHFTALEQLDGGERQLITKKESDRNETIVPSHIKDSEQCASAESKEAVPVATDLSRKRQKESSLVKITKCIDIAEKTSESKELTSQSLKALVKGQAVKLISNCRSVEEVCPQPCLLFLKGSLSTSNLSVASRGNNPDLAYLQQGFQKSVSEKLAIVKISCEDESITNDGILSEEPPMNTKDYKKIFSTKLSNQAVTGNNQNECERVPIEYLCQKEEVLIETRLTEQSTKLVKSNACLVHKEALGHHHNLQKLLKPKKNAMKLRIANMRLGPGSLMKPSLNQYKKKNKRRSPKFKINIQVNVGENSNSVGLEPPASEKTRMTGFILTHCKRRLKKFSAQNGSGSRIPKDIRIFEDDSVSNVTEGYLRKRMNENNVAFAINEPPQKCSSLISAAQCDCRERYTSQMKIGLFEKGFVSMLTKCSELTSLQVTSVVSTLSQGLRTAPSEAPMSGYMVLSLLYNPWFMYLCLSSLIQIYAEGACLLLSEIKSKPSLCSRVSMDGLETLYARATESPIYVEECGRLAGEISSAQGWIDWAKQCVSAKPPTKIEVDDLHTLKLKMLDLHVQFPETEFLLDLSEKAEAWQAHCSEILKGPIVLKVYNVYSSGIITSYAEE